MATKDAARADKAAKDAARAALDSLKESAPREVFTKEQISAINKHCKKYDLNRDLIISEIITAGLGAKGIVPPNKKTGWRRRI
jgi:hypothetical protein